MRELTEKEALYVLRHMKQYKDNEINLAINKIKRVNSHRALYIRRYKEKLQNSIPKKRVEDLLEEVYTDEGIGYELDKDEKSGAIRALKQLLEKPNE